jgi:hypothetical protein
MDSPCSSPEQVSQTLYSSPVQQEQEDSMLQDLTLKLDPQTPDTQVRRKKIFVIVDVAHSDREFVPNFARAEDNCKNLCHFQHLSPIASSWA